MILIWTKTLTLPPKPALFKNIKSTFNLKFYFNIFRLATNKKAPYIHNLRESRENFFIYSHIHILFVLDWNKSKKTCFVSGFLFHFTLCSSFSIVCNSRMCYWLYLEIYLKKKDIIVCGNCWLKWVALWKINYTLLFNNEELMNSAHVNPWGHVNIANTYTSVHIERMKIDCCVYDQ